MNFPMPEIDFESRWLEVEKLSAGDSIKTLPEYTDQIEEYLSRGDELIGDALPWNKISNRIRLGRGQLTIWAGRNASGKSVMVGHAMLNLLRNRRVVIASFEMMPWETVGRMMRQSAGCYPGKEYIHRFITEYTDKLFLYDETKRINQNKVLGMCHYAFAEMNVDHVVIDSLTKCGFTKDDYSSQAKFVDNLQGVAKEYGKHIHLIAHSRKTNGEQMGRDDVRGAGEITDLADNVFILSRNHDKEDVLSRQQAGQLRSGEEKKLEEPDAFLRIAKNRHYGTEGMFGLWFDPKSQQFVADSSGRTINYELGGHHGYQKAS